MTTSVDDGPDYRRIVELLSSATSSNFDELAKIAGLSLKLDFHSSDLRHINAAGSDFSNGSLAETDFSFAHLDESCFMAARLVSAVFDGASLKNASFDFADLRNSSFVGADITGATFLNADTTGIVAASPDTRLDPDDEKSSTALLPSSATIEFTETEVEILFLLDDHTNYEISKLIVTASISEVDVWAIIGLIARKLDSSVELRSFIAREGREKLVNGTAIIRASDSARQNTGAAKGIFDRSKPIK